MLHEQMFPYFLGINSIIVYATYFIYTLFFLTRFSKVIFKTEYLILLASILLLSLSVLIDVIEENSQGINVFLLDRTGLRETQLDEIILLIEDTSKGLGIVTWLIYFARVVFVNVLPPVKNATTDSSKRKSISTPVFLEK